MRNNFGQKAYKEIGYKERVVLKKKEGQTLAEITLDYQKVSFIRMEITSAVLTVRKTRQRSQETSKKNS